MLVEWGNLVKHFSANHSLKWSDRGAKQSRSFGRLLLYTVIPFGKLNTGLVEHLQFGCGGSGMLVIG